jgi:hypothetical protein
MASSLIRTLGRGLTTICILGACTLGIVTLQRRQLQQIQSLAQTPEVAEAQQALSLKALNRLPKHGFGFNNVIADWAFLRFLDYYGDDAARDKVGYGSSPLFFDVITSRDPRFVDTYVFLSGTLSYQLGQPELAVKYMQRGLDALSPRAHSQAYKVPSLMGLDKLLMLGDDAGASAAYGKAAEWAKESSDRVDQTIVAQVFERYSISLKGEKDRSKVRFWAWTTVFAQASEIGDRKTQDRARSELLALGAQPVQDPKSGQTIFTPPIPKPTPSPTSSPTSNPTPNPISSPNPNPTSSPISSPNSSPSPNPAVSPSPKADKQLVPNGN